MRDALRFMFSVLAIWFVVGISNAASDSKEADAKKPGKAEQILEGQQQPRKLDKEITVRVQLAYLLFIPEGYDKSDKRWPLMIFLHGAGESGTDLEQVKKHGPPKLVQAKKDFPFVVASPQSPGRGWNIDALNALLDDLLAKYKVDPERVYLTGLSMGGYGTWNWAAANPERFAAIVPICGGGSPISASKLKHLPIWAFHGGKDAVVPPLQSEQMVNAVKKAGGDPKLTIYPDAGHDSWTETYDNPDLYTWLLQHKRKAPSGTGSGKAAGRGMAAR